MKKVLLLQTGVSVRSVSMVSVVCQLYQWRIDGVSGDSVVCRWYVSGVFGMCVLGVHTKNKTHSLLVLRNKTSRACVLFQGSNDPSKLLLDCLSNKKNKFLARNCRN